MVSHGMVGALTLEEAQIREFQNRFTLPDRHLSYPGHRFDDTPEYFGHSPLMDQGPDQDHTPGEGTDTEVHDAPENRPLCGNNSMTAVYTDDPTTMASCGDCLELAAKDLEDHNDYRSHCLHCRQETTARGLSTTPSLLRWST